MTRNKVSKTQSNLYISTPGAVVWLIPPLPFPSIDTAASSPTVCENISLSILPMSELGLSNVWREFPSPWPCCLSRGPTLSPPPPIWGSYRGWTWGPCWLTVPPSPPRDWGPSSGFWRIQQFLSKSLPWLGWSQRPDMGWIRSGCSSAGSRSVWHWWSSS